MENKNEFLNNKKYSNVHQKVILTLLNNFFPNDISNLINDYTYYLEGVVDFTFVVHSEMISCFAPLSNGRVAIGSSTDQFLKFSEKTSFRPNMATLTVSDTNSDGGPDIYFKENSDIKCLAILADERVVCGTFDGTIKVWNINCKDKCELVLSKHNECVECIKILPGTDNTNEKIVSGSKDNTLKIWNLKNGLNEFTLVGHNDSVVCLEILSNRRIVSGSSDSTIKIWNPSNGTCESTLIGHTRSITCIAIFTNDIIVSGSDDNTLKLWNSKTDSSIIQCDNTLVGHTNSISCIAISRTDNKIISGSKDSTLKIWNIYKNIRLENVLTLRGHINSVTCITVIEKLLLSGSMDGSIKKWNLSNGKHMGTIQTKIKAINCLAGFPNKALVIGGSGKSILNIFQRNNFTGSPYSSIENMNHVKKLCFFSNERILAKLEYDEVHIYKLIDHECKIKLERCMDGLYVNTLNDERIVSMIAAKNGQMLIWNPNTNNHDLFFGSTYNYMSQKELICSAVLSDGRLVTCFKFNSITKMNIWNIFSGKCEMELHGHTDWVTCIVVFPQKFEKIVSGSVDKTIRIFDPISGDNESTLIGHTSTIKHLAILNNDGRLVSSSCGDETIRIWNLNDSTCQKIINVGEFIGHLKILPDSRIIFCNNDRGFNIYTINILNPNTGKCECVLIGHTAAITCITVRSDGYIVSGSLDKTIKIWNPINGSCEATLIGHTDKVTDVLSYQDGRIISCSEDKTIKIWK